MKKGTMSHYLTKQISGKKKLSKVQLGSYFMLVCVWFTAMFFLLNTIHKQLESVDSTFTYVGWYLTTTFAPIVMVIFYGFTALYKQSRDIRELEQQIELIFNQSHEAMMIVDKDANIIDANTEGIRLLGFNKGEFHAMPIGDFIGCVNANSPEKTCGTQPGCATCVLRGAVTNTLFFGEKYHDIEGGIMKKDGLHIIVFSTELLTTDHHKRVIITIKDITKELIEEEAHEFTELSYMALMDHMEDAIFIFSSEGSVVKRNDYASHLLGISVEDVLDNTMLLDIINNDEEATKLYDKLENVFADGPQRAVIYFDKLEKHLDIAISTFEVGTVEYGYALVRDVSKEKNLEKFLLNSQQQLETIFDNTPSLLCLMDMEGKMVKANKRERAVAQGLKRRNHYDVVLEGVYSIANSLSYGIPIDCMTYELQEGVIETINTGITFYRREAKLSSESASKDHIYIVFSTIIISQGKDDLLLLAIEDVTQQKISRMEIASKEVKYRTLFETSRDGIVLLNEQGDYIDANRAFLELVGYSKSELCRMNYLEITPKEWHEIEDYYMHEQLKSEGYVSSYEKQYIHKEGHRIDVELSGFMMDDIELGKSIICGIIRDISDKKKLMKQVQESHKMQAIGLLAGGIAHDFNNILSGMIGYTELALLEQLPGSKTYNYLNQINHAQERAKNLVRQILTFSRQGSSQKEVINLGHIVSEVVDLLKASVPPSIKFQTDMESGVGILADATNIHEAVMNLTANSIYAIKNEGLIRVSVRSHKVDKAMTSVMGPIELGDYAVVKVEDQGEGMDPHLVEVIFDPFYTTKSEGEGTGLGLSVVYGIMQGHEGYVVVTSALGKGTSIELYLKRSYDEILEKNRKLRVRSTKSLKILFVDDETILVELATEMFSKLGHKVVATDKPLEAIEILKSSNNFDVLMTDFAMPKMNGVELIKLIRSEGFELPVVICSGNVDVVSEVAQIELGIQHILSKPLTMYELQDILSNI